jgi:hypothetical protein
VAFCRVKGCQDLGSVDFGSEVTAVWWVRGAAGARGSEVACPYSLRYRGIRLLIIGELGAESALSCRLPCTELLAIYQLFATAQHLNTESIN